MSERFINVLYIEDDGNHRRYVSKRFSKDFGSTGFWSVATADEGYRFLLKEGEHKNKPAIDLLLLDLSLDSKDTNDGLNFLWSIKTGKKFTDRKINLIPVVILSSSTDKNDIDRAYERNAASYLVKPGNNNESTFRTYRDLVTSLMSYWGERNIFTPSVI